MKRLVTYVINVDEDFAEKAYRNSIRIISENMPQVKVNLKSIVVEPYDDYRGVIARFDYDYLEVEHEQQRRASLIIQDSIEALIKMHLWYVTGIRITSESGVKNAKDKNQLA